MLDEAILDYNKAIQLNQNFAEAFYRKGMCLINMNQMEEAIIEFKHACEINDLGNLDCLYNKKERPPFLKNALNKHI